MLKKANRLSSVKLTNPKNVYSPLFNLKIAKNNLDIPRFGFVISKKVDKRATARNSLKRKLVASIGEIFGKINGGYDLVFYPRGNAQDLPNDRIAEEVKKILSKEGILND